MKARKIAPSQRNFQYPKSYFFRQAFEYIALVVLAIILLAVIRAPIEWNAIIITPVIVLFLFFGISPLLTSHELRRRELILRQGWYFRTAIPLANIRDVEMLDRGKVGLKSTLGRPILYVTSSEHGLISIKLKTPIRIMYIWGKKVEEIIISVRQKERFLEELADRLHKL
jgi:hypothetical protein